MPNNDTFRDGIEASLVALREMLALALRDVETAIDDMRHGETTAAIGGVLTLEQELIRATALYHAILAMHRFKP